MEGLPSKAVADLGSGAVRRKEPSNVLAGQWISDPRKAGELARSESLASPLIQPAYEAAALTVAEK